MAVVAVGLAGCAAPQESSEADQVIRILGAGNIPDEILVGFEEETGIAVELEVVDSGSFPAVLQSRVTAKSDVDILNVRGGAEFNKYARAGSFLDLEGQEFLSGISESGLAAGTYDDTVFGYSQSSYVIGVHYNKSLFSELKLEVPQNWDEFMAVAEAIKNAGVAPVNASAADGFTNQYIYHSAIAIYADENPGFMDDLQSGAATWSDNKLFTRQIERYEDMVKAGYYLPGGQSLKDPDAAAAFNAGKVAMWIQGSWSVAQLAPEGFEPGAFALPINDAGEDLAPASSLSDQMFTVTSWSTKQDEALQFLEYMTRPDVATIYSEARKHASTVKGVSAELSPYQADWDAILANAIEFPSDLAPSVNGQGPDLLSEILIGVSTADDIVAGFQTLQEADNETGY